MDGCDATVSARGWCGRHLSRWRKYGDPVADGAMWQSRDAVRERRIAFFWANVDRRGPDECWPWQRKLMKRGYGQMRGFTEQISAHRFAYELIIGEVPDGLELDHRCHSPRTCRVPPEECPHRACCNPAHLLPVSPAENRWRDQPRRSRNQGIRMSERTHCIRGHDFAENGRWNGRQRVCRACTRERAAEERDRVNPNRKPPAAERTHCPQGHEYDEENTRISPTGERSCRRCARERARAKTGGEAKGQATRCQRGHLWADNTSYDSQGYRKCIACHEIALERRRERRRGIA